MSEVWRELNKREKRFVELYPALKFNGTKAAMQAGYSVKRASQMGSDLLKRPHIQKALAEKLNELTEQADSDATAVIEELKRVGFLDIRSLLEWDKDGVRLRPSAGLDEDVARAVKGVSITRGAYGDNVKIDTHSKLDALRDLGRFHGLFKDVSILEGKITHEDLSKDSDEELDKKIADLEKQEKATE